MNNFDHRVSLLFQNPCRPCPICQVRFNQTPKPEAYQYYLANDFFFHQKWHTEKKTLVCIALQQQDIEEIKIFLFCTLFRVS